MLIQMMLQNLRMHYSKLAIKAALRINLVLHQDKITYMRIFKGGTRKPLCVSFEINGNKIKNNDKACCNMLNNAHKTFISKCLSAFFMCIGM